MFNKNIFDKFCKFWLGKKLMKYKHTGTNFRSLKHVKIGTGYPCNSELNEKMFIKIQSLTKFGTGNLSIEMLKYLEQFPSFQKRKKIEKFVS